jgi:hypothetical protein
VPKYRTVSAKYSDMKGDGANKASMLRSSVSAIRVFTVKDTEMRALFDPLCDSIKVAAMGFTEK